jgi:hypothetical protein
MKGHVKSLCGLKFISGETVESSQSISPLPPLQ